MSRTIRMLLCSTLTAVAAASSAHASVLWRGDFSPGNISQWSGTETVDAADRLQVVNSPVSPGSKFALRTKVHLGDNPTNSAGGNRDELFYEGDKPQEGDERYYHWQTMFPSDFKAENIWQIFTQWHQYVSGGSPPLAFMVWGEQIKLGGPTDTYFWTAPLQRGVWHDFVFHVKWSSDPKVGGVELWYDGQHVLPFTHTDTLFPHDTVYVKQGLYRKDIVNWDQIVYHDGMTVATDLADVMPQGAGGGATTTPPPAAPAVGASVAASAAAAAK